MIRCGLRRHVLDIEHPARFINESHGKRNQRIAHPHAGYPFLWEHKQHAGIGIEVSPVHQSLYPCILGCGQFSLENMDAGIEGNHRSLSKRQSGETTGNQRGKQKAVHGV